MIRKSEIPSLNENEIEKYFLEAEMSLRKRAPKILHKEGDYNNKVFNFILEESYMRPHRHPSVEKKENMFVLMGSFALIYFDDTGAVTDKIILESNKKKFVEVPAFKWHTYVMLSKRVIVYETMEGVYDPQTWKDLAVWAPEEHEKLSKNYLSNLKDNL